MKRDVLFAGFDFDRYKFVSTDDEVAIHDEVEYFLCLFKMLFDIELTGSLRKRIRMAVVEIWLQFLDEELVLEEAFVKDFFWFGKLYDEVLYVMFFAKYFKAEVDFMRVRTIVARISREIRSEELDFD